MVAAVMVIVSYTVPITQGFFESSRSVTPTKTMNLPTKIHERLLNLALHLESENGHLCWQLRMLLNLEAFCTAGVLAAVYFLTEWNASFLARLDRA